MGYSLSTYTSIRQGLLGLLIQKDITHIELVIPREMWVLIHIIEYEQHISGDNPDYPKARTVPYFSIKVKLYCEL